jgi:hypothetical protein
VPAWAAVAGAGGVVLALAPGAGGALAGALGLAVAAGEVAARGRRAGWSPRQRAVWRGGVAALAVGAACWWLGRTGGPLCDPDSPLQPHAAWHLLTASALAAWGSATLRPAQARS